MKQSRVPVCESLEPRLLYSADIPVLPVPAQPSGANSPDAMPAQQVAPVSAVSAAEGQHAVANAAEAPRPLELVVIDAGVEGLGELMADLAQQADEGRRLAVTVVSQDSDGLQIVSRTLEALGEPVASVHLVGHGDASGMILGNARLDLAELRMRAGEIARWGDSLTQDADLLLYGCDVAGNPEGLALIQSLAQLTCADVAASDDLTGFLGFGADWDLEQRTGVIESSYAFSVELQARWQHVLPTTNLQAAQDTYITGSAAGDNFGASSTLLLDRAGPGLGDSRLLLQFDLSSLPPGATITSATLNLVALTNGGAMDVNVYTVTETWSEGNQAGAPGAANWNDRMTGTAWSASGGSFDPTPVATLNSGATGTHTWDITTLVQDWQSGTTLNRGVILGSPNPGVTFNTYSSREGVTAPYLTVTYVSSPPTIVSDGGGATASVSVAENATAVTTVAATDPDLPPETLTYSIIGGADAARFTINGSSGALSFAAAPDFESPTDAGANNVYDVIVQVSDGGQTDSQAIAVTVTGVNDNTPVITSNGGGATAAVSVAENSTAVTTVAATDADAPAQTLTYSIIGGADAARFSINGSSGALSFAVAPNFESPTDAGANNVYDVIVQASDGSLTDTQAIAVTVTAVNEFPPLITSNGGGATAAVSVAENSTAVTTVTATDADLPAPTLTYSISGGADAARFTINGSSGALSFVVAPNFESPTDAGANNVYDVIVQVSDGSLTDTQAIAVTVTPVNDNTPVIISNGGGATAAVNVAEDSTAVLTVVATDGDAPAQTLTYSISGGADAARFTINSSSGALSFLVAPDFEAPTDANADNVYQVTVQVSDGNGGFDTQTIDVTVDDLRVTVDSQTTGSTFGTSVTLSHTSAGFDRLMLVSVSMADPAGNSVASVTYNGIALTLLGTQSIGSGADEAHIELWALVAPDLGTHSVTVNLTGAAAGGTFVGVTTFASVDQATPLTGFTTNAGNSSNPTVTVGSGSDQLVFTALSVEGPNYDLVPGPGQSELWDLFIQGAPGYVHNFGASTVDGSAPSVPISWNHAFTNQWAIAGVSIRPAVALNSAPTITSNGGGSSAALSVAENATAVTTVVATDSDLPAQPLTYAIVGGDDAARFTINSSTGVLRFLVAPNYEAPTDTEADNVYEVIVQVSDGAGGSDAQSLMVSITPVNEAAPVITSNGGGATAAVSIAENGAAVTTVTATDADLPAPTLTYSISGGADAARFTIDANSGALNFLVAPDFEAPTDAGANNVYDVIVRASDGALTDTQAIAVTVTALNDNTPVITSNGGGATASVTVAENVTAVTTVTATDADLPAPTLTYSITGGADAARFTINGSSGALSFVVAPDFEAPADVGADNVYDVLVQVSDGTLTDTQAVAVTVSNANEPPVQSLPATASTNEDTPRVFSTAGGNALSVSDIDLGGGLLEVHLNIGAAGALTLAQTTGLTFSSGDGTADADLRFQGSLADVNAALDGLVYDPAANFNGAASLLMQTSDLGNSGSGGPMTDSDTVAVTVNAVNDAPVLSLPVPQTVNEDTLLTLSGASAISIADPDAGASPIQVSLSAANGRMSLSGLAGLTFSVGTGSNDAAMTFTGSLASVNAALNGMTYRGNLHFNGADAIVVAIDDLGNSGAGGPLTDGGSIAVTVAAVNDAPGITAPAPQSTPEDTPLTLAGASAISIGDVDVGGASVEVSLAVAHGLIDLSGVAGLSFTTGTGTGDAAMTFSGTLASVNAALNGLVYTPTAAYNGPDSLDITVDDLGNSGAGGALGAAFSLALTVSAVNDAPVLTLPGPQSVAEDTTLVLSGANAPSVTDIDAGASPLQVTLSAGGGLLSLSGTAGLTFVTGTGTADASMTFSGTLASINAALDGLRYQGLADFNGPDAIAFGVDDLGNTGAGGARQANASLAVTVQAVNDAPVIAAPPAQSINEDGTLVLSGVNAIAVSDVDAGGATLQVDLSVSNGTLTLSGTAGLSFLIGDGSDDGALRFTGTLGAINAALNGLAYAPAADFNGADSLQIALSDLGNSGSGGALTANAAVAVTVVAVNDAPVLTVPAAQAVAEDGRLGFAAANGNAISIADLDAASASMQISLAVAQGRLSLGTTAGLTFSTGTGSNDASIVATGSLAALRAAIDTLEYRPDADYNGADTLSIQLSDLGNTGTGGVLNVSRSVAIVVSAVNDAPTLSAPMSAQGTEDTPLVFSASGALAIVVADIDAGGNPVELALSASGGGLTLARTVGLTFVQGSGVNDASLVVRGTVAALNAALDGLVFMPDADYNGNANLDVTVSDLGNSGSGTSLSFSHTIALTIAAVNDAPRGLTPTQPLAVVETAPVGLAAGSLAAVDPDDVAGFRFMLLDDAGQFAIDPATGAIAVALRQLPDFDTRSAYDIVVRVTDPSGASLDRAFTVQVERKPFVPPSMPTRDAGPGGRNSDLDRAERNASAIVGGDQADTRTRRQYMTGDDAGSRRRAAGALNFSPTSRMAGDGRRAAGAMYGEEQRRAEEMSAQFRRDADELAKRRFDLRRLVELLKFEPVGSAGDSGSVYLASKFQIRLPSDLFDWEPKARSGAAYHVALETVQVSGVAVSIGLMFYAVRASGLVAAMLTALPAWSTLDPLVVLARDPNDRRDRWEDDSLDTEVAEDEDGVRQVIDVTERNSDTLLSTGAN